MPSASRLPVLILFGLFGVYGCGGPPDALNPSLAVTAPSCPLQLTAAPPVTVTVLPNSTNNSPTWFIKNNGTSAVTITGQTLPIPKPPVTAIRKTTWATFPFTLNGGAQIDADLAFDVGASGSGTLGGLTISTTPCGSQVLPSRPVVIQAPSAGIPFGLWGLVVGPTVTPGPWTGGTGCCKDPAQTLKQLADAKARGIKMWFSPVGHDDATGATGDFDVTVWKQQFDKHQSNYAIYNEQYAGGAYQGMILLDDITRTGWSVSFNDIETIAAYAEARIHVPTAVRQHAASLPAGTYVNLDIAWNQYSARLGDVTAYRTAQTNAATSKSLGVLFGLNILNGGVRKDKRPANDPCWPGTDGPNGNDCNMSPAELRSFGSVLGASPGTCGFMMWRNDATYLARPGVMDAMNELAAQMRSHPATSCVH